MKKTKVLISFVLLIMVVGMAVVATSFAINGSTLLAGNPDDFRVYFYDVNSFPNEDAKINIISDTAFSFDTTLLEVGDYVSINFSIINGSSNYDADVSFSCTGGNEYVVLSYLLQNRIVPANSDGQGIISAFLAKSYAGEESFDRYIYCELNATPIERDSLKENDVPSALVKTFNIGDEITLGTEKFNIIRDNGDGTVTMLAKYNINNKVPYNQTKDIRWIKFAESNGWNYSSGPNDIDVQIWGGNSKRFLNLYVSFLQNLVGDNNISGNLITLKDLHDLGCNVPLDYSKNSSGQYDCLDSEYIEWLDNDQMWWTRSSLNGDPDRIWRSTDDGIFYTSSYSSTFPIRPTITMSKEKIVEFETLRMYNIGDVVTIGDEQFNVISDNGTTVSMLAKYNLGPDYRQSTVKNHVNFSDYNGWNSTSGPREVDIQLYDGNVKNYVNEYVTYLNGIVGSPVTGDLISLNQLEKLGCNIPSDYKYIADQNYRNCRKSSFISWLNNGSNWWTKSIVTGDANNFWNFRSDQSLLSSNHHYTITHGIRPVITISKEALK